MTTQTARDQLRGSTKLLYDEFIRRSVPVTILDPMSSLLEYTNTAGVNHLLFSTCSDKSSAIGFAAAVSKMRMAVIVKRLNITMPAQITTRDIREVKKFLLLHKQIVIKPVRGSGGKGVSTNISTVQELKHAYAYAKSYHHTVVVQQHITGNDVRMLVVGGRFCSAVIRKPAHIIGDGISSIKELIGAANATTLRNDASVSSLLHINLSAAARFLGNDGLESVPKNDQEVRVMGPANVSLGGSLHQATHLVTRDMIVDAELVTQKLGLGMCGVDMMWDRKSNKHYLIEVNETPGIDIHDDPFSGTSSDCVPRYVDWILED